MEAPNKRRLQLNPALFPHFCGSELVAKPCRTPLNRPRASGLKLSSKTIFIFNNGPQ